MAAEVIQLQGLRELTRAFRVADKALAKELRVSLRAAVEPVRADAERLAVENISHIGIPWSRMRVGVTTTSVYLAPVERGRRTKRFPQIARPNLKDLLLGKAMEPALEQNETEVVALIENMLGTVGHAWEAV